LRMSHCHGPAPQPGLHDPCHCNGKCRDVEMDDMA